METRIYGTIGPACHDTDTLARLFAEGMTGVRLNLSHTSLADAADWIANIRQAYETVVGGQSTADATSVPELLMDLQGPELRIGTMRMEQELSAGGEVALVPESCLTGAGEIPVPAAVLPHLKPGQEVLLDDGRILLAVKQFRPTEHGCAAECTAMCQILRGGLLHSHLKPGQEVLLDDGRILLAVKQFRPTEHGCAAECTAMCQILRGGLLHSRKSIALQGVEVKTPTLTKHDLQNIRDAKKYHVAGVMLPFVRGREDLLCLRETLEKENAAELKILAKIENLDGVKRLPELLPHCDEIVIARGDLGNAMPLWELPVVQAQIASACRAAQKPFMIVTQMLASMEKNSVPTRAEVSDIFHAVEEGASSVMLTGETAAGAYPVEAMRYFVKTVEAAENYLHRTR